MKAQKRRVFGWSYLKEYISITQGKIIIWGFFLVPYVLVIIFYSGVLPRFVQIWVQQLVYSSSLQLWRAFPMPNASLGVSQALPARVDSDLLTIGYFVVTYLWACILVENFGTIYPRLRKRGTRSLK